EVANHNSAAQLVISGTTDSVARARRALADALPELTFVPLDVSAPFHSSLMRPVVEPFRACLEECVLRLNPSRAGAVTSNRTGGFHEPDRLVDRLVEQLAAPVRWLDNMRAIAAQSARIYEIGPAAPLSKFFVTIGRFVEPLTTPEQMRERL